MKYDITLSGRSDRLEVEEAEEITRVSLWYDKDSKGGADQSIGLFNDEVKNLLSQWGKPLKSKFCKHPNAIQKTGLIPFPDTIWLWCPDCNLLVEKIRESELLNKLSTMDKI